MPLKLYAKRSIEDMTWPNNSNSKDNDDADDDNNILKMTMLYKTISLYC